MVVYNYSKLRGRMREFGFTQAEMAKEIGVSEATLNLTLNNNRVFKQDEIMKACEVLEIPLTAVPEYFFAH